MKKLSLLAAAALLSLSMNACGIKALDPEPVPLAKPVLGQMALDHTAIPNTLKVCGKDVSDFKTSLRNGFDYISSYGKVAPVVAPEQASATLILSSLEVRCLDDKIFKGATIIFDFEYNWQFKDGSKFGQTASIVGSSEDGIKDALRIAIQNMYNYAFGAYLGKRDLSADVQQ